MEAEEAEAETDFGVLVENDRLGRDDAGLRSSAEGTSQRTSLAQSSSMFGLPFRFRLLRVCVLLLNDETSDSGGERSD
jgi:hypothetical protein